MINEKISFTVSRDFGETFNVSVKFIRQNFLSLITSLVLIAGPFILLYSSVSAHYQSVIMYKQSLFKAGMAYKVNIYNMEYFLALLLQFLALLSLMSATYAYMIVYGEKGPGNVTVKDVIKKMNDHIGKITGGFSFFLVLTIIFLVAIFFLVGTFVQAAPIPGVILVLFLFIGALLTGPNILWQINISFLVMISENEIPLSAFGRTREVMKGNYWWTWLITVCNLIIITFLSLLFLAPTGIYSLIKMYTPSTGIAEETSLLYTVILSASSFLATFVYSFFYIISAFHFFSLSEKHDGKGLMERINEIGRPRENNNDQQIIN